MSTTTRDTRDAHGNPMVAPADAAALYDRAVDRLLRYHPDLVDLTFRLAGEHPDVGMAQALVAYLHLMSTDRPDVEPARAAWEAMAATPMGAREQAHHAAIAAWLAGDWRGAAGALDTLLVRWPADLLALQIGHQLDFFVGDAHNLRDRPGRSLSALDPDHPHTAFVRGMQSFGLEESGHYGAAEEAGSAAVEANPDDVWGIHAVVHTFEMQGRVDDGIRFLTSREPDWGTGNLFTVHLWWHLALYLLEAGRIDDVLAIYDERVHNDASDRVPLEMLDASALLWRLHLDGHDTGDRFPALAEAWTSRTGEPSWYVFNDVHAVMSLLGAGRVADAERRVEQLGDEVRAGAGPAGNLAMTAEVGLPTAEALVAFATGDHDTTIDRLWSLRRVQHHFGGSHAQRDAMARTLLEAAVRAGRLDLARALVGERLSLRPSSVYGWSQRARIERAAGDHEAARLAEDSASRFRARFAAAR